MKNQQYFRNAMKIVDLLIMASCFAGAAILVAPGLDVATIREFMALRISLGNFVLFGAFATVWHLLYVGFGLYEEPLFFHWIDRCIELLKATSIGTCAIVAAGVPFQISFMNSTFMLIFWVSVTSFSVVVRLGGKALLIHRNRKENRVRNILIVGANDRSLRLASQIRAEQNLGCRVVGIADDTIAHVPSFGHYGFRLVTDLKGLSKYVGKTAIDEVIVCLPIKSQAEEILNAVSTCEEQGISIGILRDLFKWDPAKSTMQQFGDQAIVMVHPHGIVGARAATKRAIDLMFSLLLLVICLPLFVVTSILIKLTSPGPVLFAQERIGLNKKRFRMLKFRTMMAGAELQQAALEHSNEALGPVFKIRHDPRITSIGKFLRRSSIDELPQLINVVKGDMSLVGPRPLPLRDYAGFREDWHRRRVSVRPGITGLWQVDCRDHSSFDHWMKLDLDYIDQWSLKLDAKIMMRTVPAVMKGSGT